MLQADWLLSIFYFTVKMKNTPVSPTSDATAGASSVG